MTKLQAYGSSRSFTEPDNSPLNQTPSFLIHEDGSEQASNDGHPSLCHCCRKWEIPERSFLSKIFNNESDSSLYCHFCMKRVCSIECVHEDLVVVPRLFNVNYNL